MLTRVHTDVKENAERTGMLRDQEGVMSIICSMAANIHNVTVEKAFFLFLAVREHKDLIEIAKKYFQHLLGHCDRVHSAFAPSYQISLSPLLF